MVRCGGPWSSHLQLHLSQHRLHNSDVLGDVREPRDLNGVPRDLGRSHQAHRALGAPCRDNGGGGVVCGPTGDVNASPSQMPSWLRGLPDLTDLS